MATKYETLKVAAGRFDFSPGQIIDLDRGEAKELLDAGAVRLVEVDADGVARPVAAKKKASSGKTGGACDKPMGTPISRQDRQSGNSGELDSLGENAVKALGAAGIKSLADAKKYLQDNGSFDEVEGLSKVVAEQLRERIE